MSLVALDGTPLVAVGGVKRQGHTSTGATISILLDATAEAWMCCGQIFTEDGGSHTIDTTGSSSLGFRTGVVSATWNAGTVLKVGLATVDAANGPPARATNVANVVTFDVNGQYITGTAPTTGAWNESVPTTGTKTVANGDLIAFAIQMVTQGGTDTCNVQVVSTVFGAPPRPASASFLGGSYAALSRLPDCVITFSDGKLGFFYGGYVCDIPTTTTTWNSGSSPNEYGNFFQLPVPVKVYGLIAAAGISGDVDFVLYSDPLGTPAAQKTVSIDLNVVASTSANEPTTILFASPYTTTANQPLAGIMKPTSVTNITSSYLSMNSSANMKAWDLGTNCYAVNRASGAFGAQNSNKDRYTIGLLIGAWDDGSGGSGGFPVLGGPFT